MMGGAGDSYPPVSRPCPRSFLPPVRSGYGSNSQEVLRNRGQSKGTQRGLIVKEKPACGRRAAGTRVLCLSSFSKVCPAAGLPVRLVPILLGLLALVSVICPRAERVVGREGGEEKGEAAGRDGD